jgi:hypothetical protein
MPLKNAKGEIIYRPNEIEEKKRKEQFKGKKVDKMTQLEKDQLIENMAKELGYL